MLDDLRSSATYQDDEPEEEAQGSAGRPRRIRSGRFLGMTPVQRFVVALLLLMVVCLFGSFALIISGAVSLPVF
jgi:hypothetical protein